jgi:uncharacterized damage-inducible protein DinB
MTTPAVEQWLYLFDAAFDGEDWHALLANLHDITPEEWIWVPPRGARTVRELVEHIGSCKLMYDNHAFGDASFTWDDPLVRGEGFTGDVRTALDWLRDAHAHLRASIAALDDAEPTGPRRTNWGEIKETRWIIAIMIQHDLYHAGEINHLRSLYRGDDRWEYAGEA